MRVLGEVGQLLAGPFVDVAPAGDELADRVARLVGVHLVAEEEQEVGPAVLRLVVETDGVRPQRVHAVPVVALGVVADAGAAGAVQQPGVAGGVQGADAAGRERRCRVWPDAVLADEDLVRQRVPRGQPVDVDHGVRVAVHAEGGVGVGAAPRPDRDDRRTVDLDPDDRGCLVDVAEHRPQNQWAGLAAAVPLRGGVRLVHGWGRRVCGRLSRRRRFVGAHGDCLHQACAYGRGFVSP
ncbi:MAG: hypothetical protein AVDCRST_MAG29-2 [uncultured Nocardioidaceae bacterium]|uniref:Uncharacterized protein n=1 Tax=uncultured Nocardioidaceae bacterium TaxID=253824 RepID=A0A6J4KU89_9ACTN|nr:MAG: hypothetical protein AVDCRST_MAG29-2 [uncultured Nocardioidaceae bacterium]